MAKTHKDRKQQLADPLLRKNHAHQTREIEPVVCRICNGERIINGDLCARCDGEGVEYVES